jgi:3-oxo-5alpha-steroid 4-dehydrogenase
VTPVRRFEDISSFDLVTDVLIAGYGGAGPCAATEARRAGSEVLILEWSSGPGGSTALSACEMYLGGSGGTRLQKDLRITDSTENFYNYLMACFGDCADEARVRVFTEGAAKHFDWVEALGLTYNRSLFSGRDVVAYHGSTSGCSHVLPAKQVGREESRFRPRRGIWTSLPSSRSIRRRRQGWSTLLST